MGLCVPVPLAMGDGTRHWQLASAISTCTGGLSWKSPCMSASRPAASSRPRRLSNSLIACGRMSRSIPTGIWPKTIFTACDRTSQPGRRRESHPLRGALSHRARCAHAPPCTDERSSGGADRSPSTACRCQMGFSAPTIIAHICEIRPRIGR